MPSGGDGGGGNGKRTGLIIGGVVAVLALAGGGLYALSSGGDDEADDTTPDVTVPDVSVPDITIPDITVPDITVPDITIPDITLPPDLSIPDITFPDFTIPDITIPDITIPDISIPDITLPGGEIPPPTEEPTGLGDDPALDDLAQACYDGEMEACDDLFDEAEPDSEYRAYGDTCAGRQDEGTNTYCVDAFPGSSSDLPEPTIEPGGLGTDPELDGLAQDCYDGDMEACDDLFIQADSGSAYEDYGDTCAGRQPPDSGFCTALLDD